MQSKTSSTILQSDIYIKGARVHNLKNVDVSIPRNKFIVVTGVSGSGKSSLTIDTLFAEGQRRYAESLSALNGMPPVIISAIPIYSLLILVTRKAFALFFIIPIL